MEFSYPGIRYEPDRLPLETSEGDTTGKTWGSHCGLRYPRHIPVPQLLRALRERALTRPTGTEMENRANSASRLALQEEPAKIHYKNLCRNIERRLEVARRQGNEKLIQLLEAEFEQVSRSWQ